MRFLLVAILCVSIACAQNFNAPGEVPVPPVQANPPNPTAFTVPDQVVVSLPTNAPVVNTLPPSPVVDTPPKPTPTTPVTNTPPVLPPKPLDNKPPRLPPQRDRNIPVVWLCDQTGKRRAQAATPEAEKLIDQGVKLQDCTSQNRIIPPRGGSDMMCDASGRPRGRASSGYVQALIRRGTQLTPCAGNQQGGQIPPVRQMPIRQLPVGLPPRGGGASDMMCDAQGRPRGRASSGYVQALIRRGTQLTPCNQAGGAQNPVVANPVANPVVANPVIGNRFGGGIVGIAGGARALPVVALPVGGVGMVGMMCDAQGRPRGRASSGYVQALIRSGMQLQPCGQQGPARANEGDASTFSGAASATPGWAIALIVVSSLVIVLLIVVVVRLTQILKN